MVVSPHRSVKLQTQQERSSVYTIKAENKEYGACFLKRILQASLFCTKPWVLPVLSFSFHHL